MYFSEVQIVEVSFVHLWWNLQGFNKNWKVPFAKREFCFALSYTTCNIQVKATLLVIWKLESVSYSLVTVTVTVIIIIIIIITNNNDNYNDKINDNDNDSDNDNDR